MENAIYKINKYPDGSSYITLLNPVIDSTVSFTYRINSYEDLWHLGLIMEALTYNWMKANITIPCLFDAQADRRFEENQSAGLRTVCKFLNTMPDNTDDFLYRIYHPHNPEVIENVLEHYELIDNSEFMIDVLSGIGVYGEREAMGTVLMSSDAGGFKPLMKLCDKIEWNGETYSASKARKWDYGEEKSILTQIVDKEDFEGKDVVIVDDICVYGGTFKGLSKLLRERNVGKLYLAVSHITIQNHKGKDTVFDYFDKVFTTNSKFNNYWVETFGGQPKQPENLEIIKLFDI